jgi:hypothetical protein
LFCEEVARNEERGIEHERLLALQENTTTWYGGRTTNTTERKGDEETG